MRRSLFIAAFVAGFAGGCFLRPIPAPGFRHACESAKDCQALDCKGNAISLDEAAELIIGCDDPEVLADPTKGVAFRQSCVAGLCSYSCSLATFQTDCPSTEGFQFCFNSVCATVCGAGDPASYDLDSNDGFCTTPQTCVPLSPRTASTSASSAPSAAPSAAPSRGSPRAPASAAPAATTATPRPAPPVSTAPARCASRTAATRRPPPAPTAACA
jgi:hypothetical protein